MNYWVLGATGDKYGPADLTVLNQWAAEGRITAATELEEVETGNRLRATEVAGLMLPLTAPEPTPTPSPETPSAPSDPFAGATTPSDPFAGAAAQGDPFAGASAPSDPMAGSASTTDAPSGQVYNPYNNPVPNANLAGDFGQKDITIAYVCSGVGFLLSCCCGIFAFAHIPGIIFAVQAKKKGHPGGQMAVIVTSVLAFLTIGVVVAALAFNAFAQFMPR